MRILLQVVLATTSVYGAALETQDGCLSACEIISGGDCPGDSNCGDGKYCSNLWIGFDNVIFFSAEEPAERDGNGRLKCSEIDVAVANHLKAAEGYRGAVTAAVGATAAVTAPARPQVVKSAHVENGTIIGAIGIENLGNTCYLNSILQAFSHSGPVMTVAVNLKDQKVARDKLSRNIATHGGGHGGGGHGGGVVDDRRINQLGMVDDFISVLGKIYARRPPSPPPSSESGENPTPVRKPTPVILGGPLDNLGDVEVLRRLHFAQMNPRAFVIGQQEDADEAIRLFLDTLSEGAQEIEDYIVAGRKWKKYGRVRTKRIRKSRKPDDDSTSELRIQEASKRKIVERATEGEAKIGSLSFANLFKIQEVDEMICGSCGHKIILANKPSNELIFNLGEIAEKRKIEFDKVIPPESGMAHKERRQLLGQYINQPISLAELFDAYSTEEIIEKRCEICEYKRAKHHHTESDNISHTKRTKIVGQGPSVLVIVFSRFLGHAKVSIPVSYGRDIDLNVLTSGSAFGKYRLSSIVFHHGPSAREGHYTSQFYNLATTPSVINTGEDPAARWYNADDAYITELPNGPILTSREVYVLVYDRTD